MDSCAELFGSGDSDSIFLDQHSTASSSPVTSRGTSVAISPTSLPSAGSSPRLLNCRHGFSAQQQRRSPLLSSNASTTTSGSEASASSSGSNHSSSSRGTGSSWGTLAKHRPLKAASNGDDCLLKVLDKLRHSSQSLRQVVSSLANTYDDDVLANVQQFNEHARAAESSNGSSDTTRRQHLKLRRQTQDMQVVEALQEFWSLTALESTRAGDSCDVQDSTVVYEMVQPSMHQNGFVAYAFLPGGSCFRSLAVCSTRGEARRSAAEVALMNSVHNELPSRQLSDAFIHTLISATQESAVGRQATTPVHSAASRSLDNISGCTLTSSDSDRTSWKSADILRAILGANKGRSLLSCKENLVVFQLLQWSGILQRAKSRGLPLRSVIQSALATALGQALRQRCSATWADKECEQRGTISRALQSTKRDLERLCIAGRESRFAKEKRDILVTAFTEYQRRQQSQTSAYDTPSRLLAEYQHNGGSSGSGGGGGGVAMDSPRRAASQRSLLSRGGESAAGYQYSTQSSRLATSTATSTRSPHGGAGGGAYHPQHYQRAPYTPMSSRGY